MTDFTTDMPGSRIVWTGVLQGFGLGFVFVPLSTMTFATLPGHFRNEGTALFSLVRNIGSSIGISVVITYLAERTQINHAAFSEYVSPFNPASKMAIDSGALDLSSPLGFAMIDGRITAEAATLAYLQDFRLMMWITLAACPLLLLLKAPAKAIKAEKVEAVME